MWARPGARRSNSSKLSSLPVVCEPRGRGEILRSPGGDEWRRVLPVSWCNTGQCYSVNGVRCWTNGRMESRRRQPDILQERVAGGTGQGQPSDASSVGRCSARTVVLGDGKARGLFGHASRQTDGYGNDRPELNFDWNLDSMPTSSAWRSFGSRRGALATASSGRRLDNRHWVGMEAAVGSEDDSSSLSGLHCHLSSGGIGRSSGKGPRCAIVRPGRFRCRCCTLENHGYLGRPG